MGTKQGTADADDARPAWVQRCRRRHLMLMMLASSFCWPGNFKADARPFLLSAEQKSGVYVELMMLACAS